MHMQRLSRMQSPASPLGGGRHSLIWRLLQRPWDLNIVSFHDQTIFLYVNFVGKIIQSFELHSSVILPLSFIDGKRIQRGFRVHPETFRLWDGICSPCLGQGLAESTSSKVACMISPASVILCSGNTRSNDPSRIVVEACTKPSIYMQSKFCDPSPAVSANAHVITDAVGIQLLLACIQEIRKRFAILGSHTGPKEPCFLSTSFMLVCYFFPMLIPLHFLHNINRLQKRWIPAFKEQSLWWFRSIFRPDRDICFPEYGFFAHTGSEMDLCTPLCANMSPIQFKLLQLWVVFKVQLYGFGQNAKMMKTSR